MIGKKGTHTIRRAWFAGSWYSADPAELETSIELSFEKARSVETQHPLPFSEARFAVLPHAGHTFSSRGIAHAFAHIPAKLERIVILGPSHYAVLDADRFTTADIDTFETPLGEVKGFELFDKSHPRRTDHPVAVQREHALEMILPFIAYLQHQRKQHLQVSVALVSQITSPEAARLLASDIEQAICTESLDEGKVMVIASSDFTHYGRRFNYVVHGESPLSHVTESVKRDDLAIANFLARGDVRALFLSDYQRRSTVCGLAAAEIVSSLAFSNQSEGYVADYYTSLDVLGGSGADFVTYCTLLWR